MTLLIYSERNNPTGLYETGILEKLDSRRLILKKRTHNHQGSITPRGSLNYCYKKQGSYKGKKSS